MTTWTYRDDGSTKRDNMLDTIATTHPAGVTDTVGDYSYTWDANKNKTSEAITGVMSPYGFNSAAGQQPAAYDADDRLVGWNRNDGNLDQAWTLTPVGDWDLFTEEAVTQDRSHGPAHEIIDVTIGANTNSVQHDVKGNVTFIPAILRGSGISDDMTLVWGKRGRGSFVRSTRRAVPANDPRPLFPDGQIARRKFWIQRKTQGSARTQERYRPAAR